MRGPESRGGGAGRGSRLRSWVVKNYVGGFAFVREGGKEAAMNFLPREGRSGSRNDPGLPESGFPAGPGAQGRAGGGGRSICSPSQPREKQRGGKDAAPQGAYLCGGALRAPGRAGARRCPGAV